MINFAHRLHSSIVKMPAHFAATLVAVQLAVPALQAQDEQPEPAVTETVGAGKTNSLVFELTGSERYTFRSDLHDSKGDVSVSQTAFGLSVSGQATDRLRLTGKADGEWSIYNFDGTSGLFTGRPDVIDDVYMTQFGLDAIYGFDSEWAMKIGGSVAAGWEDGAEFSDSISGLGYASAIYTFDEDFSLSFGVGVASRLDKDPLVLPLIGFRWQINDRTHMMSNGLGLEIGHKLTDQFDISLAGGWEARQYRLNDDGVRLSEGSMEDQRAVIGIELAWKPTPALTLALEGGAVVYQEYKLRDDDGDRIDTLKTDPAPFIGVRIAFQF